MKILFKHQGQADRCLKICREVLEAHLTGPSGARLPTQRIRNAFCNGFGYQSYNVLIKNLNPGKAESYVAPSEEDLTFAAGAAFDKALPIACERGMKLPVLVTSLSALAVQMIIQSRMGDDHHNKQFSPQQRNISREQDREFKNAAPVGSVFLGYDDDLNPVYWSEQDRLSQSCVRGVSGLGKTRFLKTIFQRDLQSGHPIIYFDGKHDNDLVRDLKQMAEEAGRGADVLLIDPADQQGTANFDPFRSDDGALGRRVDMVLDSLSLWGPVREFFTEYERDFLHAIVIILQLAGEGLSFSEVLIACQDRPTIERLLGRLESKIHYDETFSGMARLKFSSSASFLSDLYEDQEWQNKVRRLLNSMQGFLRNFSAIIDHSDNLVTFEQVIDQKKILIISMSLSGREAQRNLLGSILLRNLSHTVASRYNGYSPEHFVPVTLDEVFWPDFKNMLSEYKSIVHMARKANAAFIFSCQNNEQWAGPEYAPAELGMMAAHGNGFVFENMRGQMKVTIPSAPEGQMVTFIDGLLWRSENDRSVSSDEQV
jgi:hypothetical protein